MSLPDQPEAGRRLAWVIGRCWRCELAEVPVIWLGPVHSDGHGGSGPFHACEPCIRRLEELVAEYGT
ncbi:hypothetical protein [Streptomyces sp. NPDC092952]|uniref:hypothetical protein n=1 Tax=Streptomyces sp. NPDC092952 TaxID=3366018 RepID=UPI00381A5887